MPYSNLFSSFPMKRIWPNEKKRGSTIYFIPRKPHSHNFVGFCATHIEAKWKSIIKLRNGLLFYQVCCFETENGGGLQLSGYTDIEPCAQIQEVEEKVDTQGAVSGQGELQGCGQGPQNCLCLLLGISPQPLLSSPGWHLVLRNPRAWFWLSYFSSTSPFSSLFLCSFSKTPF